METPEEETWLLKLEGYSLAFEEELLGLSWEKCQRVDSNIEDESGLFNRQNGLAFTDFSTITSVGASARCLAGAFKGEDGKEGFIFVNVEDTSKKMQVSVRLSVKKIGVYINAVFLDSHCAYNKSHCRKCS